MTIRGTVRQIEASQAGAVTQVSFRVLQKQGREVPVESRSSQVVSAGEEVEVTGNLNSEGVLIADTVTRIQSQAPPPVPPAHKLYFVRMFFCAILADIAGLLITAFIVSKLKSSWHNPATFLYCVIAGLLAALLARAFTETRRRDNALLAAGIAVAIPLVVVILTKK